ncbi:CLUMA_CG001505, isoform A [Clunio marinus]|uniref:CLUMA_CG001505, isoform A n=1 Tax=Clunio marinus TaxID=568069 RepID=A0A1J1HII5_9DIPT|nr:CLUMA_CG001505, isoform A [Clunio marinus]
MLKLRRTQLLCSLKLMLKNMDTSKVKVNKGRKNLPKEELDKLSKDELVEMIIKLEAHNKQLKNILEKKINPVKDECKRKESDRSFDFSKHPKRHVLLKFCYLGWDYEGFVTQENTIETIEHHLFEALTKVCLIERRQTSNYNRCGRTDKGVSAFEQVISIDLRSKIDAKDQLTQSGIVSEIKYCSLLNRVLPKNIRAISWMPLVTQTYSARFDCIGRTYRYFFPRGDLNVSKMQEACSYLVGSHDFRNLCKMDVGNGVVQYIRRLDSVNIKIASKNHENLEEFDLLFLEIKGSAFLWHMIRCIVSILMIVGQQRESPSIVKELLDVEKNEQKPQYALASEFPLILFKCDFREDQQDPEELPLNIDMLNKWIYDEEGLKDVIIDLQEQWCSESVKSIMIYEMLKVLQSQYANHFSDFPEINMQACSLNRDYRKKEYKKLMDRDKGLTLEDRICHYTKRRRIFHTEGETLTEVDSSSSNNNKN